MLLKFAPWKVALIALALLGGAIMCLPNVLPAQYTQWIPTRALNLGLDLKGGASILLEVDPDELRTNRLNIDVSRSIREKLREAPLIAMGRQPHHPALAERFADTPPAPENPNAGRGHGASAGDARRQEAPCFAQTIPEPVFGIIKSALGFRQFLLRGLDKARGEWSLVTMAWNIKRMFTLSPA